MWIAIHDSILGSKLRGLRKRLKCSEAEALGILAILWIWARNNTDITGHLKNTEREDIAPVLAPNICKNVTAYEVVDALIEEGWLDEADGELYVHDWGEWQSQWYAYLEKKHKDSERKRIERERKKSKGVSETLPQERVDYHYKEYLQQNFGSKNPSNLSDAAKDTARWWAEEMANAELEGYD